MADAYDPLNYDNLAQSVVRALMDSAVERLPPPHAFAGSGVYAIFYLGRDRHYSRISSADCRSPIYVGKAMPSGARKGSRRKDPSESTGELHTRLRQHARSIDQVENLDLIEFRCRYLVVEPVWITLAERFLIDRFQPVWNTMIDGFGNHDPGGGRRNMRRPRWDIVHPGRPWAARLTAEESSTEILDLLI